MAVELGLEFDLSALSSGLRGAREMVRRTFDSKLLTPFDAAMKRSGDLARRMLKGTRDWVGGAVKGVAGQIAAVFALQRLMSSTAQYFGESIKMSADFEDSISKVEMAVRSLSKEQQAAFDPARLAAATQRNRLTSGVGETKQNEAFAGFLGRGFDPKQAQTLLTLSIALAAKSGKDFADVAGTVASAANGSTRGLRALGIQIQETGDKERDAIAAVEAMANFAGSASDLVDPIDLLGANLDALKIRIGDQLRPETDAWISGLNDLLIGMLDNRVEMDAWSERVSMVGTGLGILGATVTHTWGIIHDLTIGGVGMIKNTFAAFINGMLAMFADALSRLTNLIPGLGDLTDTLKEMAKVSGERAGAAGGSAKAGMDLWLKGLGGAAGGSTSVEDAMIADLTRGSRKRTAAEIEQQKQIRDTANGGGFAGSATKPGKAPKEQSVKGYANLSAGSSVRVVVMSRNPDKLRTVSAP